MAEGPANTQLRPATVIIEEQRNAARGRRNNSIACLNCRRRKVKVLVPLSCPRYLAHADAAVGPVQCSSDEPKCSNCRLYNVECTYVQDRRRSAQKSHALSLLISPRRVPVQAPSRQWPNGTQPRTVKGFTTRSTPLHGDTPAQLSPRHRNFSHFNVEPDFVDLAEEASGDGPVSDDILLALASTSDQDWPGWIEGDEASDPFLDLAGGVVPGDGLAADLCPFDMELPVSHPNHDSFLEPQPSECPGERQDALSSSMSPPAAVTTVVAPSKDDRARKWSVVTSAPSPDDDASDVTEQLTNRLGRLQIAEDGHPRYFGSTSNLYILHHGPKSLHKPNIRDVMALGDAAADKAGYHWTPAPEYEAELITLFFSWYNALVNVVDQDIFFRERARFKSGRRSDLYSPALENAVWVSNFLPSSLCSSHATHTHTPMQIQTIDSS